MTSYYTTGHGITVLASESNARLGGKPRVEVTFLNAGFDPTTASKPYDSFDEAKVAAKAIADQINKIAPRGFPRLIKVYRDADHAAREAIDTLVREWAGPDAVIDEIED